MLASAASRVAFITFSKVRALAKSPLTLTLPVMNALAGASSPETYEKKLLNQAQHVMLHLKHFRNICRKILKLYETKWPTFFKMEELKTHKKLVLS